MYTATGVVDRKLNVEQFVPLVKRMAHHLLARLPASFNFSACNKFCINFY